MLVVHVRVRVKEEYIREFIRASLENAQNSLREPGIDRFDVLQDREYPSQFLLVEAYRTPEAPAEHKATEHYKKWKESVESMMAEPRVSEKFVALFPA